MNLIGAGILGMGIGAIITFLTIILFANYMDKNQKELYINVAKDKNQAKKKK